MNKLTFMDFCAGIGGGRLALDNLGMQCVGFSTGMIYYT
jgi:DNA (cytosine-5)-methyltransferase 1